MLSVLILIHRLIRSTPGSVIDSHGLQTFTIAPTNKPSLANLRTREIMPSLVLQNAKKLLSLIWIHGVSILSTKTEMMLNNSLISMLANSVTS